MLEDYAVSFIAVKFRISMSPNASDLPLDL